MKKYFLKENGEELKFGDTIVKDSLDKTKDGCKVYSHKEYLFTPDVVQMLLDKDIITTEEGEDEKDSSTLTLEECDEMFVSLMDTDEELAERILKLEDKVRALEALVQKLTVNKPVDIKKIKKAG